ncbi:hypothetical protein H2248_000954 [Termitomyces sp. 'cryptogamus']|nr:hypothetical protein H2248_000954 [Termitomyces sp. 'cryptogamus']
MMPNNKPSSVFLAAASYLTTVPSQVQVSTAIKLELYGLFKYVTTSPSPSTTRPSIFDMTGRAKWDAWNSASKNYTSVDDAENRYLDIAKSLGWVEGTATVPSQTEQSDPDSIWDDDSQTTQGGGASGGMGGTVSTMMISAADTDESLHGLAVSNDITALSELFQNHPEMDVNQFDEFGYTPLHLACDRGNLPTVEFLLGKGADPTIMDSDGLTATEIAAIAGHDAIEHRLKSSARPR